MNEGVSYDKVRDLLARSKGHLETLRGMLEEPDARPIGNSPIRDEHLRQLIDDIESYLKE